MSGAIKKAVFPVAGLGTRFLPATKTVPKELLPVFDKPLIQLAVEEALDSGIELCIFITRRGKSLVVDHFDRIPDLENLLLHNGAFDQVDALKSTTQSGRILSVRQPEPLGLGHAVGCAAPFINNEPFAVLLPDDYMQGEPPCLGQMIEAWHNTGGNMVAVTEVPETDVSRYGILDVKTTDGRLVSARGLVEKPDRETAPSRLAISGRYILDSSIIKAIQTTKPDARGEIQLTNAINATLDDLPCHGYRFKGKRFDCGQPVGFLEASVARALVSDKYAELAADRLKSAL